MMGGFGAGAYSRLAVDSGVAGGDPHQLVLMLYDGALAAARQALGHMQAGRVADKGAAISKAIRIVDEGLKISLDKSAGGQLALRLGDLYDYATMRLLQANLRNDVRALEEVIRLLDDLRGAWTQIRRPAAAAAPVTAAAAPPAVAAAAAPALRPAPAAPATPAATRFLDGLGALPVRRFAASA